MPWTQFDNTGLPSDVILFHPAVASSRHPSTGVWTLWSIGGTNDRAVAYTSTNGTSWQPFADALGWPARRGCGAAWLQSQGLLLIGGDGSSGILGDAWIWMGAGPFHNADELYKTMFPGDSGKPVQSWGPRKGMCLVTFKDRWFVFGGDNDSPTVFASDSWIVWQQLTKKKPTDPDPWKIRRDSAACVFRGRIFMLGGTYSSEVYSTDDGITWRKATIAPWSRELANAVVVKDVMYLLGGSGDDGKVWKTSDGDAWEALPEPAPWYTPGKVSAVSAGVLNDKIYVWGGPGQGSVGNTTVWCYTP